MKQQGPRRQGNSPARVNDLKSRLDSTRQHIISRRNGISYGKQNRAMQQMQKERKAIQTIMERKIKTLTDNIMLLLQ